MTLNKRKRAALISLCREVCRISDDPTTQLRASVLITKLNGADVLEIFDDMLDEHSDT